MIVSKKNKDIRVDKKLNEVEKLMKWNHFIIANKNTIELISKQTNINSALIISFEWYKVCIKLGIEYYQIKEITDSAFDKIERLEHDLNKSNYKEIEKIFISAFTDVINYQIK